MIMLRETGLGVYINNKSVDSITPSDYHVNTGRYQFNIESGSPDTIELTICGEGKSDGLGAILNNVHVWSLKECQEWYWDELYFFCIFLN